MKAQIVSRLFTAGGVALLIFAARDTPAQSTSNLTNSAAAARIKPDDPDAPPLSNGAEEIMWLEQVKVSPGDLRSFVEKSHLVYNLDKPAIAYLRQQGVPAPVITAMLEKDNELTEAVTHADSRTTFAPIQPEFERPAPDYGYTAYTGPARPYDYYGYRGGYPYYGNGYPFGVGISLGVSSDFGWGFGGGGFGGGYRGGGRGGGRFGR
jgi:hypothetical protein